MSECRSQGVRGGGDEARGEAAARQSADVAGVHARSNNTTRSGSSSGGDSRILGGGRVGVGIRDVMIDGAVM